VRTPIIWLALGFCSSAYSSVIAVGPGAFAAGSAVIDFTGLPNNTEVNGLIAGGVQFTYSVGGPPVNGAVVIDGGPGATNNIAAPNIVSVGDNTGILSLLLPAPATLFGYGYAILSINTVVDATTIDLFLGANNVGTLAYTGAPDPIFAGGFAGIQSTVPFDRVELTFNSTSAPAFAVDNITFSSVPETATMLLTAGAIALLGILRRQRT
jgi:hypothetical protein